LIVSLGISQRPLIKKYGFPWTLWNKARLARSAYVYGLGSPASKTESLYSVAESPFKILLWAAVAGVNGIVLHSLTSFSNGATHSSLACKEDLAVASAL
jgi:ABC-type glucose/galactose transport system permease subunit